MRPPLATAQVKVISQYIEMEPQTYEQTVMTVPAGKVVVITDILLLAGVTCRIFENTSLKIYLHTDFGVQYHFNSGIPFSSGTNIIVKNPDTVTKRVFISGYEVDQ
jgi:hypothetical protein